MKLLGQLIAFLIAPVLIVGLACAVWTFSASQMILDADTYKNALAQQGVYDELLPAVLPALVEVVQREGNLSNPQVVTFLNIIDHLDAGEWAGIAANLIPPDWLRSQLEPNLDAFFRWLSDETAALDVQVNTRALRERLSGPSLQRAVNQIIVSWPPCTDAQLETLLNFDPQVGNTDFPFCQPPGEHIATMSAILSGELQQVAAQLPDVLPTPGWLNNPETRANLEMLKRNVRVAQALVLEMLLLPVALLSLIVFFAVRSLQSFGRWAGGMLLLSGILTVVPIPLLLSPFVLPARAGAAGPGGPTYVDVILQGVARSLVGAFTLPILIQAGVILALGFVALVVSVLVRAPEEAMAAAISATMADSGAGTAPRAPSTPVLPQEELVTFEDVDRAP